MVIHSKLVTDFCGNSYRHVLDPGNESLHNSEQQEKAP